MCAPLIFALTFFSQQLAAQNNYVVKFDGKSYTFKCDSLALLWEKDSEGAVQRENANGAKDPNGKIVHILIRSRPTKPGETVTQTVWDQNRARLAKRIERSATEECPCPNCPKDNGGNGNNGDNNNDGNDDDDFIKGVLLGMLLGDRPNVSGGQGGQGGAGGEGGKGGDANVTINTNDRKRNPLYFATDLFSDNRAMVKVGRRDTANLLESSGWYALSGVKRNGHGNTSSYLGGGVDATTEFWKISQDLGLYAGFRGEIWSGAHFLDTTVNYIYTADKDGTVTMPDGQIVHLQKGDKYTVPNPETHISALLPTGKILGRAGVRFGNKAAFFLTGGATVTPTGKQFHWEGFGGGELVISENTRISLTISEKLQTIGVETVIGRKTKKGKG